MKKILLLIAVILTTVSLNAQVAPVELWWNVSPNGTGKIFSTHPATNFHGYAIEPDSTMWELCAKPTYGYTFSMWTIRYYQVSEGIINDTVTNDHCIYIDTNNTKIREIACIAWFVPEAGIDPVLEKEIILYPNPASEIIYFNGTIEEYKIFDTRGRMILCGFNTEFIDASELQEGFYIVHTEKGNFKLIKL